MLCMESEEFDNQSLKLPKSIRPERIFLGARKDVLFFFSSLRFFFFGTDISPLTPLDLLIPADFFRSSSYLPSFRLYGTGSPQTQS